MDHSASTKSFFFFLHFCIYNQHSWMVFSYPDLLPFYKNDTSTCFNWYAIEMIQQKKKL